MSKETPSQPEEDLQRQEIYSHILAALKALEQNDREAFILCDIDGLTCREAAECMMVSRSTIRRRLHRARIMLRKKLAHLRDL